MITLRPLDDDGLRLAASWLAQPDNYRWLDFGAGRQEVTPGQLKLMHGRASHRFRLFGPEAGPAIGLVALSDLSRVFETGMLWYVLGDKSVGGRGYTTRAVKLLLDEAFGDLGLRSVGAWTVESNKASIRVLERNRFRLMGRRRASHVIEGAVCDRLLFDLLASEHRKP